MPGRRPLHADPLPAIVAVSARACAARHPARAVAHARQGRARAWPAPRPPRTRNAAGAERRLRALPRAVARGSESRCSTRDGARRAAREKPLYLVQDTHFAPSFMELIARDLAKLVGELGVLPPLGEAPALHVVEQPASRVGDLVDMLKLPDEQQLFQPQSVLVHQVQNESGDAWEPDPAADVLLLGDSFTNIFSLEGMGWGSASGLAPHLALALQSPDRRDRPKRLRRIRHAPSALTRAAGRARSLGRQARRDLGVRVTRAVGGRLEADRISDPACRGGQVTCAPR